MVMSHRRAPASSMSSSSNYKPVATTESSSDELEEASFTHPKSRSTVNDVAAFVAARRPAFVLLFVGLLLMLAVVTWSWNDLSYPRSAAWLGRGDTKNYKVATWNVAAINNNPFEYWLTLNNDAYDETMDMVQGFIQDPGVKDIAVSQVFTQKMFEQLVARMKANKNFKKEAVTSMRERWNNDFKSRRIISGFMKDPVLGQKRLASMPDRVTNTIPLRSGAFAYRPTVINCYAGKLASVNEWWKAWSKFMFDQELDTVKLGKVIPASTLKIIPRAKYGALSEKEERMSIPLQTLVCAIFDSVLVHMMNTIDASRSSSTSPKKAGNVSWQALRSSICHSLNLHKNDRLLEILETKYGDMDVVCLQEVAASFIQKLQASKRTAQAYHVVPPSKLSQSDQNSVLLLARSRFPTGSAEDISHELVFDDPKMVAPGDILLVRALDKHGNNFALASFHGDTNGLATIPVVSAVSRALRSDEQLLFGLDANTYQHGVPGKKQDVLEFVAAYSKLGFESIRGADPDPAQYTTYNARTFLQPQLNKASSKAEIKQKGDVNPKDFILYRKGNMRTIGWSKDNTGDQHYIEGMVFPTPKFPSDHGVLYADVVLLN